MNSDCRVVIVTGAASGIGLATVETLLAAGADVIGVDLAGAPASLEADERVAWVRGDISEEATWQLASRETLRRDPRGAGALVSCAADIVVAPFLETGLSDWRRLYEVNVLGVIRGMRTVMPAMIARRGGAIAVVCSVDALVVEQDMSAYATSKAALLHLTRAAALEHAGDGLIINAVCPGVVDTPLLRRHLETLDDPDAALEAMRRRTPTGKILTPQEVARVLRFLVSDHASGMSGATITVDGGLITTYDYDSLARAGDGAASRAARI